MNKMTKVLIFGLALSIVILKLVPTAFAQTGTLVPIFLDVQKESILKNHRGYIVSPQSKARYSSISYTIEKEKTKIWLKSNHPIAAFQAVFAVSTTPEILPSPNVFKQEKAAIIEFKSELPGIIVLSVGYRSPVSIENVPLVEIDFPETSAVRVIEMGIGDDKYKFTRFFLHQENLQRQPKTELLGIWPNPFNPSTTIHFSSAGDSPITLKIYNTLGQEVTSLIDKRIFSQGIHRFTWEGIDQHGRALASGIYLMELRSKDTKQTKTITLLK